MSENNKTLRVEAGQHIPFDGRVVAGCALVDESACSGVSTPVWVDSASGSHEVYKDGYIVSGWLEIEPTKVVPPPAPVPEKKPEPAASADRDATPQAVSRKVHPAIIILVALVAATICSLVATQFTDSDRLVAAIGCLTFVATALEGRRALS